MRSGITGFVTTSFPRSPQDPAGAFVLGMARALVARGHEVEVIVPESPGPHRWGDPTWLEGIRVWPAPYARPSRLQRLFFGAGAPDNLSSSFIARALVPFALAGLAATTARRSRGWDRVVSHWLVPSALVASFATPRRIPRIAIAHSGDVHLLSGSRLGPLLGRRVLRGSTFTGFVSRRLLDDLGAIVGERAIGEAGGRVGVVSMGIDPGQLVPSMSRESIRAGLGLSRFAVLALGRLVRIKGFHVLLEAARRLEDVEVVIAGGGPMGAELEEMARSLGDRARLVGEVGPAERAELMAACDALAVPSVRLEDGRQEGLPVVIAEAMAAGLPVLASRTGGISEIVEDGRSGLLVEPGDPVALAGALGRLASDRRLADLLARNGRRLAAGRTWDRVLEEGPLGIWFGEGGTDIDGIP